MSLTNEEKDYLTSEVKYYINEGCTKAEAKKVLELQGFRSSTIDKYWFIWNSVLNSKERE